MFAIHISKNDKGRRQTFEDVLSLKSLLVTTVLFQTCLFDYFITFLLKLKTLNILSLKLKSIYHQLSKSKTNTGSKLMGNSYQN